uniref:Uncharacterized protein n=1 Tax=Oryza barthii TaxID=65489 RepID=A0A0D3HJC3_9ORYZ
MSAYTNSSRSSAPPPPLWPLTLPATHYPLSTSAPSAYGLRNCNIASRLEFLIPLLGSYKVLLKTVKRSYRILTSDIEEVIKPNFAQLQECGLTVYDIVKTNPRLLSFNPERIKRYVHHADMLGVPCCSPAFRMAVCSTNEGSVTARMEFLSRTLGCSMDNILMAVGKRPTILGPSMDNLRRKIETLGCSMDNILMAVGKRPTILGPSMDNLRRKIESTLGCSEDKLRAAVCISPHIFYLSDKNLCRKIDFLISEVGLEREFIVERPWVLGYSLEKRMVPRHSVMKILRTMGLMKDAVDFSSSLVYSEKKFVARYIDPYKQAAPTLADSYAAACAGKMPAHAHPSGKLAYLKSSSNPDAELALLSGVGLSRADLAAVVAADPMLLCARPANIALRLHSLRDRVGLSDADIAGFLLAGGANAAQAFRGCDIASRLEFWIPFLGSFEMLLKIVRSNYNVLTSDLEKVVKPNIALLQECGLTVCDIAKMFVSHSRVLTMNPKRMEACMRRTDELGVQRSSRQFKYVLSYVSRITEGKAAAKMRFLSSILGCSMDNIRGIVCRMPSILGFSEENIRSTIEFLTSTIGCSQDKICAALCKNPNVLGFSDENLRHKINFMITEVGLEPEDIVERLWVLTFSLEKRMVPRHSVIKILRAMGKDVVDFSNSLIYSVEKFIARYIDPYKQAAPTLADTYAAACAGKIKKYMQALPFAGEIPAGGGGGAMLHLRQRLLLPVACAAHLHTSFASRSAVSLHLSRLLLSTAAPFSVEDYLAATCSLTGDQALKASKKISHLRSAANPDAVLAHLSGVGLSRAELAAVVAIEPQLLCVRADNIARRIASLRDRVGLSDPQIGLLLRAGGAKALCGCDIAPRVEFLIPFVGSFEMLLKMVKACYRVLTADIEKVIKPNIAALQECGLTVYDIVKMASLAPRMLVCNPKQVESSARRADELGLHRSSGLFKYGVAINCCISEDKAAAKMRFLSSILGCSMDKVRGIVCRTPAILGYSEENIGSKIEFLASTLGCSMNNICCVVYKSPPILGLSEENLCGKIEFFSSILGCPQEKICAVLCKHPKVIGLSNENLCRKINFMIAVVGLEPEDIVERLWVLTFSLEKRMVPRHSVIKILRAMGNDVVDFSNSLKYSEKKFIARCIDPYKKAAPTLVDAYAAACAGKMSDGVHL